MDDDLKEIKKAIKFMVNENLTELEIQEQDYKLKIKRKEERTNFSNPVLAEIKANSVSFAAEPVSESVPTDCVKISSPLGGVFYRAPALDAKPFVEEREEIKKGQTMCIIEAMKLMNEIQAEGNGQVYKILPKNGQMVETGQILFLVIPG